MRARRGRGGRRARLVRTAGALGAPRRMAAPGSGVQPTGDAATMRPPVSLVKVELPRDALLAWVELLRFEAGPDHEVGDDVGAVLRVLEPDEGHLGGGQDGFGIGDPGVDAG